MSWRFYGEVDSLNLIDEYNLWDGNCSAETDRCSSLGVAGSGRGAEVDRSGWHDVERTAFSFPECIHQLVLESQPPPKIVNFFVTITYWNIRLKVLWGSWLSKTNWSIHSVRCSRGVGMPGRYNECENCPGVWRFCKGFPIADFLSAENHWELHLT